MKTRDRNVLSDIIQFNGGSSIVIDCILTGHNVNCGLMSHHFPESRVKLKGTEKF